jgi:hypothetical protein
MISASPCKWILICPAALSGHRAGRCLVSGGPWTRKQLSLVEQEKENDHLVLTSVRVNIAVASAAKLHTTGVLLDKLHHLVYVSFGYLISLEETKCGLIRVLYEREN